MNYTLLFIVPKEQDRVEALNLINERTGFSICQGKISLPYCDPIETKGLTLDDLRHKFKMLTAKI